MNVSVQGLAANLLTCAPCAPISYRAPHFLIKMGACSPSWVCVADSCSCAMQGTQHGPTLELPLNSPPVAAHLFLECTQMDPELRPSAAKIVEWLRSL